MKKKSLWSVFLVLSLLILLNPACSRKQEVIVGGTIISPAGYPVVLTVHKHVPINEYADSIEIQEGMKQQQFKFRCMVDGIRTAWLKHAGHNIRLFLEPGDSLFITFDNTDVDTSLAISGRGADNNLFFKESWLLCQHADHKKFSKTVYDTSKALEGRYQKFQAFMDIEEQKAWDEFRKLKTKYAISKRFENFEKNRLKYYYADYRMMYPINSKDGKYYDRGEQYDFLDTIKIYNEEGLLMYEYWNFLQGYTGRKYFEKIRDIKKWTFKDNYYFKKEIMPKLYFAYMAGSLLETLLKNKPEELKGLYEDFVHYNPHPDYTTALRASYLEGMKRKKNDNTLKIGEKTPPFTFMDIKKGKIPITDFQGKAIFLSFWASFCPSCGGDISLVNKLREKLKGKDVVFLFISIDTNEKMWKKAMEKKKLDGYHMRITKGNEIIKKLYNIYRVPRHFLIDKNGILVDKNAKRPGFKGIDKAIEKLL